MFVPSATEQIISRQDLIVLKEYEVMVLVDPQGRFVFKHGWIQSKEMEGMCYFLRKNNLCSLILCSSLPYYIGIEMDKDKCQKGFSRYFPLCI
jgi:hypothetical protein